MSRAAQRPRCATEKLRIGALVLCNSFRNPALLTKSLTTIDHISNGRLEIGLGAGWMEEEYRGYGYEFPSTGTRLRQLEEGLQIMKLLFTEKRANFDGRYYKLMRRSIRPSRSRRRIRRLRLAAAASR